MSSRGPDMRTERVFCKCPYCCAVGKQGGLCITSQGQLVSGAFEAKSTEVFAKRGVNLAKNAACDWECVGQILSHSRLLRALAGKE